MSLIVIPARPRGCGIRKRGGLYIEGEGITVACPGLPLEIPPCPSCLQPMIDFFRGCKQINPGKVLTEMIRVNEARGIKIPPCNLALCDKKVCAPVEPRAWVMWVGKEYTPESFIAEAVEMGVSKRVNHFPKDIEIGDAVYLGYKALIRKEVMVKGRMVEKWDPGLFYAFRVTRKVKMVSRGEAEDPATIAALEKEGITAVYEYDPGDPESFIATGAREGEGSA